MIARINAAVAAAVGFATGTAASRAADDDFNIQNYFHSCTGEYADLSRGVGKDIVTRAHLKYEPTHPLFYEPFNATLTFTTDHDIDAKQLRIVFDVNFLKEFHYDWNIADYLDEEQCMMHLGTLPYEIALAKKDGRCTILKGSYTYTFEVPGIPDVTQGLVVITAFGTLDITLHDHQAVFCSHFGGLESSLFHNPHPPPPKTQSLTWSDSMAMFCIIGFGALMVVAFILLPEMRRRPGSDYRSLPGGPDDNRTPETAS